MAKNASFSRVVSEPKYIEERVEMQLNGTAIFVGGMESIIGHENVLRMSTRILKMAYTSIVLDKGNPIWSKLNLFYLKIKESGIFDQLKENYWYQDGKRDNYKPKKTRSGEPMTLSNMIPVMIVLSVGFIPSVFVFIVEFVTKRDDRVHQRKGFLV